MMGNPSRKQEIDVYMQYMCPFAILYLLSSIFYLLISEKYSANGPKAKAGK